jgi:2-polyprenyl-3-methyl-5-hydroxy-6-metoxy-1,4-benzoquinol methylase
MNDFDKYIQRGAYHWAEVDPDNCDYNPPLLARYQVMVKQVPAGRMRVLDVGCGDGYLSYLLCRRGIKWVVGIDADAAGVRLSRQKLQEQSCRAASQLVGSAYALPFADGSYDTVVMADVIEHLDDPCRCLGEVVRVLGNNGAAIFSTPCKQPDRVWDRRHVQEFEPEAFLNLLEDFFPEVTLLGCWPMPAFNLWVRSKVARLIINAMAQRGFNLFELATTRPTRFYGQLIAICRRSA